MRSGRKGERGYERDGRAHGMGRGGKVKGNLEEEDGNGGGYSPQTSIYGAATVYRCFPKQLQTGDNNFRNGTAERTVIGQLME